MFARKGLFLKVGGFNPHVTVAEDTNLTSKLQRHGRFKFLEDVYIIASMRRFEKKGYIYPNLLDIFGVLFGLKRDEWVRN